MIALGGEVGGLFTPSDAMAAAVTTASKAAGAWWCAYVLWWPYGRQCF
jgi:hypothetical protein